MKKSLRILTVFSVVASSILFVPSASAIGTLYNGTSGDVACTSGFFTIASNVVTGNTSCTGSAVIPMGVLSIGQYAFSFTNNLTSVTISNSVTSIGNSAFDFALQLSTLTIGDHVTSIGAFAFFYVPSLISLTIPDSVISIGPYAFFNATSLTSLSIPNNVTTIGDAAFNGSSSLTSLTIPNGVTSIGANSFTGTSSLSSYRYCGTVLTSAQFSTAGLGSKTKTCPPSVTAPGSPTSVVATSTGKRSATVSFAAPASNGGSAVTSYTATSTPGGLTQTITQATGGTFNFDGLQPSTAYSFAVTAKNAIGTSSAATSNSVTTSPLEIASLSALSFVDDGTGTAGKIVWAGMNVDRVLYTGPARFYPGPFKYGAFTSGWNGLIRNLTPDTTYTVSINAHSADGVGGEKSLTFKTNAAPPALPGAINENTTGNLISDKTTGIVVVMGIPDPGREKLYEINTWLNKNTFVTGEASNMYGLLKKFFLLEASVSSTNINVPTSRVSNVVATSLTPTTCSVISATAAVDAGLVTALSTDKCTISYTVTGGSNAPATIIRDFVFSKYASSPQSFACGDGFYTITAGVVSSGESCTGAVTIDPSATSIEFGAFQDSTMSSISIPNSVTAIPNQAFASSAKLTKVELGNAVTSIGIFAFAGTGLVSISLPVALRTIGIGAFYGTSLTSLTIPVGTTNVSYKAFSGNKKLETIIIPSTITDMSELALTYSWFKTVNYCGSDASVLAAIAKQPIAATCVAPAIKP